MTYWLIFLLPAFASVLVATRPYPVQRRLGWWWVAFGVCLALLIGFRHEVGGDWATYEEHYQSMVGAGWREALERSDPGYYLLTWLSTTVGGGVYLVNLVFGALFSWGLLAFCRQQPRPWLALAVAVPYMVIVVGMGYSRQGVALGLVMLGLTRLPRHDTLGFVLWVALAASFHKSAVLMIPLAVLASPKGRLWSLAWVGITAITLFWVLLAESIDALLVNYVEAEYQSEGAAVRLAMNALPAAVLLLLRKRFVWEPAERNLWTMLAIAALLAVVALVLSPSSTAVDRVALYLIPLQLYFFSRLPDLLGRAGGRRVWVISVVVFYATVQFVWINFASHAQYWLPYRFYPFEGLF